MSDRAVRLLRLLADGASAEELAGTAAPERPTANDPQQHRRDRADTPTDDTVPDDRVPDDEALRLALTIRRTLDTHTRREAELAALFDTASDLARLRDLDAVLRSIVHRARMLLRVDVSYLSLNDDGAEGTYIRVTDGSASALFQQVRLGMGEGLGGLVAQTARPYATSDYPADDRFRHTGPIDDAVGDEGLIAILGVPLSLGDRVIGVLYASDRRSRTFTPDEVALLSSLADHAAIAIDNARLIESTAAALDELGEANETIRAHHEALARAQDAHDRLAELAAGGADVTRVAEAVAVVLNGGIVVRDPGGAELARAGAEARGPSAYAVASSRASGRAVADGDDWVCAVMAGTQMLGSITLTGRPLLADADRRLFERAGMVTALVLLLRSSAAEAEERVRGELLTDLLSAPDRDPGALLERGRRLGLDLSAPHAVLLLHTDADAGITRARLASAAADHGVLAGVHADRVVVLAADADPGETAPAAAAELTRRLGCPVTVGGAGPVRGPERIADAHAEAGRCLRALLVLGRRGSGADTTALGFVGLLLGDRANVPGFVRDTLGPVLDYDAARGTELLRTVEAYFAAGGNLTRAKETLHVHVNTVAQRLDRIRALLGDDWQSPDRALELQLALRLHRLS